MKRLAGQAHPLLPGRYPYCSALSKVHRSRAGIVFWLQMKSPPANSIATAVRLFPTLLLGQFDSGWGQYTAKVRLDIKCIPWRVSLLQQHHRGLVTPDSGWYSRQGGCFPKPQLGWNGLAQVTTCYGMHSWRTSTNIPPTTTEFLPLFHGHTTC